jgi:hypothetical protein
MHDGRYRFVGYVASRRDAYADFASLVVNRALSCCLDNVERLSIISFAKSPSRADVDYEPERLVQIRATRVVQYICEWVGALCVGLTGVLVEGIDLTHIGV